MNTSKSKSARARVAANVLRLRTERDWSQEGLAEAAGFHRTYVSQLERQVSNITVDNLQRLATALRVDVMELLRD